jgi:phosphatidylserine/phosphatidylglycerophosphate/cardiolipin synthase-like enzyme/uncharacterized membrane protein YdjX (TVP38/TMEM64 family)
MNTEDHDKTTFSDLLRPGKNCWRIENADRVGILIDTANYFEAFKQVCGKARRSLFILGWDFDRCERLGREDDSPALEDFIYGLLEQQEDLHIYLLLWDFHLVYAAEREWFQAWKLRYNKHERLHVQFDGQHPPGGSQHQKLVVADDRAAFCGGIDLSRWRWDTSEHKADEPRRTDPDGDPYPPFHDAMLLVEGDVAAALGELTRARWEQSGAPEEPPALAPANGSLWPEGLEPLFEDQLLAIARTYPEFAGREAVEEVKQLFLDSIAAARDYIYIENQYFTSSLITDAIAGRLAEDNPPDVLLVLPRHTGGWLEQVTMDALRTDCLDRLREADRHGRLRVFYPEQPGLAADECISVHCKLMIADDCFLHLGSANTSDRSLGLDSECDLALHNSDDSAVSNLLNTFLAEHLDCEAGEVAEARKKAGALNAAVEQLRSDKGRSLLELERVDSSPAVELADDADLVDPAEPINPEYLVGRAIPKDDKRDGRRNLYLFLGLVLVLLALGAAWRWTPLSEWVDPERLAGILKWFDNTTTRAVAVTAVFVLASLAMVPVSLLVVLSAILLGPWLGFGCAMLGAMLSGFLAFLGGQLMGGAVIERFEGSQIHRLSQSLSRRGIMAVAMVRLIPVAPYTVVNLVAGASHLRIGQFMIGSFIGLLPGIGALTLFSGTLYEAIMNPSAKTLGVLGVVAVVVVAGALLMRRLLKSS